MDAEFWHQRWEDNNIAFHMETINRHLQKQIASITPAKSHIFVPLCGKTRDIGWLLSQGYRVTGAELSGLAIEQLFRDLALTPEITEQAELVRYSSGDLTVFCGDIFALTKEQLGRVDAVYDRAALVALPAELRRNYSEHLMALTDTAPQLMICYHYDQTEMPGPPFAVPNEEVLAHYEKHYLLDQLSSTEVEGGLKGKCAARENVWRLHPLR
ncbi:thiopurine S-methyltransferase [Kiloniella sp. b19]|uniref:thiopurine S-methyltransferase n=1 Tax=Kiloniella sp. GXU_MW_B19 TaxID=3141326 RepID=UPI0031DAD1DF